MSERAKRNQEQTTISFAFAFVDSEQTTIPVLVGQQKTQSQHYGHRANRVPFNVNLMDFTHQYDWISGYGLERSLNCFARAEDIRS